ncbi:hypothetical protein ABZV31_22810 [Streptomyces sp. NPDC005202]|uniref:hypothetical protein n=1 Tax=Streptomyces sp. NPDC005202 TaxID=3157021 RepID=UPI0033BCD99E
MHDNSGSGRAVGFLLGLIEDADARRVRDRVGAPAPVAENRHVLCSVLGTTAVPASVLLWILEEDDPELNAVVWGHRSADDAMRRAVLRGVPFGRGRTDALPVDEKMLAHVEEPPVPGHFLKHGLVGALRESRTMGAARAAATMVLGHSDWQAVAEADREQPLPGWARSTSATASTRPCRSPP